MTKMVLYPLRHIPGRVTLVEGSVDGWVTSGIVRDGGAYSRVVHPFAAEDWDTRGIREWLAPGRKLIFPTFDIISRIPLYIETQYRKKRCGSEPQLYAVDFA